jgi:hypothetical protein
MAAGAAESRDGRHRYVLWRDLGVGEGSVCFLMLNPSTASGTKDDPTIRKCCCFAKRWGYRFVVVVNLFTWRATYPSDLADAVRECEDVTEMADLAIAWASESCDLLMAAWGANGADHRLRVMQVEELLAGRAVHRFALLTKSGDPRHPLMLSYVTERRPLYADRSI